MGKRGKGIIIRNGWGKETKEVKEERENTEADLINKERDVQRQWEDSRIRQARYNK